MSLEQQEILKKIFLTKKPFPTDAIRAFIEDFMAHAEDFYRDRIIREYCRYLKEKNPQDWYENLVKSCPYDKAYSNTAEDKTRFLRNIKLMKKNGQLSDYNVAKAYMQGGANRLIVNGFLMNAFDYFEKYCRALWTTNELSMERKMTVILMRLICFTNSMSGINAAIARLCLDTKEMATPGTPRKSALLLQSNVLFSTLSSNETSYLRMTQGLDANSGLLILLLPFKKQFDSCINRRHITTDDLLKDFWEADDAAIVLIDRLIKLLQQYETQVGINIDDANRKKMVEFIEKLTEFQLFFFHNQADFFTLYGSLESDAKKLEPSLSLKPS